MQENTLTFTARSGDKPDKSATFTLHNGSVTVELGNVLVEQVSKAYDTFGDDATEKPITSWFKPAATGTLQKLIEPIPLTDFDAEMSGDDLQTTAWIRAGGLRLAPVMMTWHEVDNPQGAQAFVSELQDRKETALRDESRPDPFDYWASWFVVGLVSITLPLLLLRRLQRRRFS